jgi:hypothetical protein
VASGHRTTSWGLGTGGTGALYSNAAWQLDTSSLIERVAFWRSLQVRPVPSRATRQFVWNWASSATMGQNRRIQGRPFHRTLKAHGERVLYESYGSDSKEGFLQLKPSVGLLSELKSEKVPCSMTSQLWRKEDGRQEADAYGRGTRRTIRFTKVCLVAKSSLYWKNCRSNRRPDSHVPYRLLR